MMTLKDIKVSKNRIPVQNAIWLRPIGGLKFKAYYPHGGDWAEISTNDGSDQNLEERVSALEKSMENVVPVAVRSVEALLARSLTSVNARITNLEQELNKCKNTLQDMENLIQLISYVYVNDSFDTAANDHLYHSREDMYGYGFTETVLKSLYLGYCKTAIIKNMEYNIVVSGNEQDGSIVLSRTERSEGFMPTDILTKYTITVMSASSSTTPPIIETVYIIDKEIIMTPVTE